MIPLNCLRNCLIAIGVMLGLVVEAQPTAYIVTGTIKTTAGEPLAGSTVLLIGSTIGTYAEANGSFSFEIPAGRSQALKFRHIGYKSLDISGIRSDTTLHVRMQEDEMVLEEVIVTALPIERERETIPLRGVVKSSDISSVSGESYGLASSVESITSRGGADMYKKPKVKRARERTFDRTLTYSDMETEAETFAPIRDDLPQAGQLTAGEINDFHKWDLWQDLTTAAFQRFAKTWQVAARKRYTLQLTNQRQQPLIDAQVDLLDKRGQILWTAHTDNTGKAELWSDVHQEIEGKATSLRINYQGKTIKTDGIKPFQKKINQVVLPVTARHPKTVDIAFVIDATGSMSDEIAYLQSELTDVMQRIQDTLPQQPLRLGCVFYRDHGEAYLTQQSDFSTRIEKTAAFVRREVGEGGGDTPEAVDDALSVALQELSWSEKAAARLLFLVLDAPPHRDPQVIANLQRLIGIAAQRGIRIIPITCSGIDKSTEYLMRTLALASNGTYTFLTDDSGIGGAHLAPSTDTYKVELLNELLIRVVHDFGIVPDSTQDWLAQYLPTIDTAGVLNEPAIADTMANDTLTAPSTVSWRMYPNPTSGPLTIAWEGELSYVYVADLTGKLLLREAVGNKSALKLNLSAYPAGIYLLKATTPTGQTMSARIIKRSDRVGGY